MLKRFRESEVAIEGVLIKQGVPIPMVIPPKTNMVHFLRHMYAEHKSGKLYVPRQVSMYSTSASSKWSVIMWGGGRQKVDKIRIVDVQQYRLPKTLQLIDMLG